MSEEKAIYTVNGENNRQEYENWNVRDEAPHNYFISIPNMIDDAELPPHTFRLYSHLRRVAGENGACWQSTKTLAKHCCMSVGQVSISKRELANFDPPLIRISNKRKNGAGDHYHEITITDIWSINALKYQKGSSSHSENGGSPGENGSSHSETKKNPIKKNPVKNENAEKTKLPLGSDIGWMLAGGVGTEEIEKHLQKEKLEHDATIEFERALGFNSLNWNSPKYKRLLRCVIETYKSDAAAFACWADERRREGQYSKKPSADKIRADPEAFADTWPTHFPKRQEPEGGVLYA
uniref:Putative DNA binding, helix-turn-helix domain containing protein n=1 Tax=viral metagenome TaxID=1070528 RepID=A0A6H1ZAT7_9ZZZZ